VTVLLEMALEKLETLPRDEQGAYAVELLAEQIFLRKGRGGIKTACREPRGAG
jgi:hypothetical protein